MEYKDETILSYPHKRRIQRSLAVFAGALLDQPGLSKFRAISQRLDHAHKYYLQKREYESFYNKYVKHDCLTDAQIKELVQYQDLVYVEQRREYFKDNPVENTIQGLIIPLVESIIEQDVSIKSVLNIGVRYAFVDHILATNHPDIDFKGVDFATNLEELNKSFLRDNLSFVSGYALHLLERKQLIADIVVFSSTATLINNLELRRYLRILSNYTKYIIFNEPIFHPLDGSVINPTKLKLAVSVPVFDKCLTHNYKAMAKEAGFDVLHYRVFPYEHKNRDPELHMLNLIAHNKIEPRHVLE